MPRNVRAYWIDAKIDGRGGRRSVSFGPPGREGDADVTFYIRDHNGEVREVFSVLCRPHGVGSRQITIQDPDGRERYWIQATEGGRTEASWRD